LKYLLCGLSTNNWGVIKSGSRGLEGSLTPPNVLLTCPKLKPFLIFETHLVLSDLAHSNI